jgi:hypothetical protein
MHGPDAILGCALTRRGTLSACSVCGRLTKCVAQVTVDLDVQVRSDLLSFLREDSERRRATILCKASNFLTARKLIPPDATHIFDGMNEFPTHIAHMRLGTFAKKPIPWSDALAEQSLDNVTGSRDRTLFKVALQWLREDREHRRELEKAGRKTRGARRGQVRTLFHTKIWGAGLMRLNQGRSIKLRGIL